MNVCIKPSAARGTVAAPPSKSYTHRLLICAALSNGRSEIHGIAQSEDMLATLDCIRALGARVQLDRDTVWIDGCTERRRDGAVFPCRESGSTLRFFLPLSLLDEQCARFTGTARLMERGISVYETLFRERGILLQRETNALLVQGRLTPGTYRLRGDVSSQFVSGLLFALPLLDVDSTIDVLPPVESRAYIDITIDAMRRFGIRVEEISPNRFFVPGGQRYCPADAVVEGDWSNAAALLAFNNMGGDVTVTGLNPDSMQGDRVCPALLEKLRHPGTQIDLSACPDLGPVLMAVAAAGHGAFFSGTARLQIKDHGLVDEVFFIV